jgi:hypothetical protein
MGAYDGDGNAVAGSMARNFPYIGPGLRKKYGFGRPERKPGFVGQNIRKVFLDVFFSGK